MNISHSKRAASLLVAAALLFFACRGSADNATQSKPSKKAATPVPAVIPLSDLTGVRDAVEKRHAEIRKILDQKISGDFSNLTLKQAMDRLSQQGKLFPVDYAQERFKSLKLRDGVKFEAKTREQALRRILKVQGEDLSYAIQNESLKVFFGVDDGEPLFIKSYKVTDLAFPKASRRARRANPTSVIGGVRFGSLNSTEPSDHDWLVAEIKNLTSGPWREVSSFGGTLIFVNGLLRVRQSARNHAEIRALLDAVRAARKGRLRGGMSYLHEAGYPVAADAKIIKRWSRRISIEITKLPLEQAVARFSRVTGIPMRLAKKVLVSEGVDLKAPITFRARNAVAYSALQRMLRLLEPPVTFVLERGELIIVTETDADEKLYPAIYDVRDFASSQSAANQLMRTLKHETSSLWLDDDGIGGTMSMLDEAGALIVSQTQRSHYEIAAFLQDLRKNSKGPLAALVKPKPRDPNAVSTRIYLADGSAQAKELMKVIPIFVEKNSWDNAKSDPAIQVVDNKVIVRQTAKVHAAIRAFLADLDAADQTDRLAP